MARCEKCIHFDVCYLCEIDNEIRDSGENPNCLYFFPTADVVEVVRCKDCKHYGGVAYGFVCRFHSGLNHRICTHEDDFCSYGRRKNEKREEKRILSERQEKRKRQIQRMRHSMAVCQWHLEEPFPLMLWRWIKWKRNKPKLEDFKVKE